MIDSLHVIDQQVQKDIIAAADNKEKKAELIAKEKAIFKAHIPLLKKIVNEIGYPTIEKVGKETSHKFFLMVQHSDAEPEFQYKMLQIISKEVEKGNVAARDYAYLTDRVMLALNKPQVYGTQVTFTKNGRAIPRQLSDSLNVNQRRKKMKLGSIEEYLNKNIEIHFMMNAELYKKRGIEAELYKIEE